VKVLVAGLGVQGRKRLAVAGADVAATVDPVRTDAQYRAVADVPLTAYEAALVCTPDDAKVDVLRYLLGHGKHVLVEKPLLAPDVRALHELERLAARSGTVCYTAYNHRFEPHVKRMRDTIASGVLGCLYLCRVFYGNGTARDVRDSPWRDRGLGVLADLGSHVLDMALYWFETLPRAFSLWYACRFENRAYDHALFGAPGAPALECETSLISWRNEFRADVYGERGSAHIRDLCKWGPSTFTIRTRMLPSGAPQEESAVLAEPDRTWAEEYEHFKALCARGGGNLANDMIYNTILHDLGRGALQAVPS
jgi:scyllo-inositol 2-dehydrogenase (NADP+)